MENTELIPNFMDLAKQDQSDGGGFYLYEHPISGEYVEPEDVDYLTWNLLMPVVKKILKQDALDLGYDTFKSEEALSLQGSLMQVDINLIYQKAIEFIEYYNENQEDK